MTFREGADQQVELLDVLGLVAVDLLDLGDLRFVIGEVLEAVDRIQSKLAAELVVARHATFPGPQDIDRAHVEDIRRIVEDL